MSGLWPLVALPTGAAASAVTAVVILRRRLPDRVLAVNHAGRTIPRVLGAVLVGASLGAFGLAYVVADGYRLNSWDVVALASVGALGAAGAVDDLSREGPRGLGPHVSSLLRGRPTTGILKLFVGLSAAIGIAWLAGEGAVRVAAGAVLIGLSINVWNALDVAPGRSLKWGAIALAAVLGPVWGRTYALLAAGTLGAVLGLLPFDLRERGMLGDAGSNPLGLVVGMGLFLALPEPWLVAGAGAALLLQVAAETVTITRLIEATPPLGWLDRLGRRRS